MNDEDFVLGYVTGYNDGAQSGGGGSGVSLDDYPVFPKKFRFGDSDFYFLVGDINTGFYDSLLDTRYDSTAGTYNFKNTTWYRCLCVILCKGEKRFAVFNANGNTPTINTYPAGDDERGVQRHQIHPRRGPHRHLRRTAGGPGVDGGGRRRQH